MHYYRVPVRITESEETGERSISPDMNYNGGFVGEVVDDHYILATSTEVTESTVTELTLEEAAAICPNAVHWTIIR